MFTGSPSTAASSGGETGHTALEHRAYASAIYAQETLRRALRVETVARAMVGRAQDRTLTSRAARHARNRAHRVLARALKSRHSARVMMGATSDLRADSRARLVSNQADLTSERAVRTARRATRWIRGATVLSGLAPRAPGAPAPGIPEGVVPAAPPVLSFDGSFETGDFSQWSDVERVAQDRIRLVTNPVRLGQFAARFEVRDGDKPSSSGERAEIALHYDGQEQEGDDFYYSFSFMLPPDWVQGRPGFRIPLQFHGVNADLGGRSTYPPVALNFVPPQGEPNGRGGGGLWLETHGGDLLKSGYKAGFAAPVLGAPVQAGVWHDLILHVVWHRSAGRVTIWHKLAGGRDWTVVTDLRSVPTLQFISSPLSVSKVYMRQGLYRADFTNGVDVIYEDATRRAPTFADAANGL